MQQVILLAYTFKPRIIIPCCVKMQLLYRNSCAGGVQGGNFIFQGMEMVRDFPVISFCKFDKLNIPDLGGRGVGVDPCMENI